MGSDVVFNPFGGSVDYNELSSDARPSMDGQLFVEIFNPVVVQGTWVPGITGTRRFAQVITSTTGNINDEIYYLVYLPVGTYDLTIAHQKGANYGIISVYYDATLLGAIDTYNSSSVDYFLSKISGFAVASAGLKILTMKMGSKNASSGAYGGSISSISLQRLS